MITINVENLYKKYHTELFFGLAFSADSLSPLVVTGRNGSGKSTLLNIISGLKNCDSGRVDFYSKNEKLDPVAARRKTAMVSPCLNPYDCFRVVECINFVSYGSDVFKQKTLDFCREFKIPEKEIYGNLSNGMKQKLKISIALAKDASILLLDEPFSDLDEAGRKYLNAFLKKTDAAVILATNDKKRLSFSYKEVCLDK